MAKSLTVERTVTVTFARPWTRVLGDGRRMYYRAGDVRALPLAVALQAVEAGAVTALPKVAVRAPRRRKAAGAAA